MPNFEDRLIELAIIRLDEIFEEYKRLTVTDNTINLLAFAEVQDRLEELEGEIRRIRRTIISLLEL
jgi:hypothetical protein